MVWRPVLVPATFTPQLHGVIQVAMSWEGIHLLAPLFERWYPGL